MASPWQCKYTAFLCPGYCSLPLGDLGLPVAGIVTLIWTLFSGFSCKISPRVFVISFLSCGLPWVTSLWLGKGHSPVLLFTLGLIPSGTRNITQLESSDPFIPALRFLTPSMWMVFGRVEVADVCTLDGFIWSIFLLVLMFWCQSKGSW